MMQLPLSGVRVFEMGNNVAGPYATWILAELGAEVIKIERPEGDDARSWGPPFWNGTATTFHAVNRNKKSMALDLKDSEVVEKLRRRMIEEGDVILQSLRPGTAAALGFSPGPLLAENPRLIYCNLHAFGAKGPMKDRPGYDTLMQAFGGIMSMTGEQGRPPVRVGVSLIDMGTGMWCAIGILTALYRRNSTGVGGIIDASLFETTLAWMTLHSTGFQVTREAPTRGGTAAKGIVPYQGYQCADGYLIVAASNDRLFSKLAKALGHAEWADDDRFASNPRRVENREALNTMLEEILIREPRAIWQETLDAAGVPNSPIQSMDEVLSHPQTRALGLAQETEQAGIHSFGLPIALDGTRPPLRNVAPELGADNDGLF